DHRDLYLWTEDRVQSLYPGAANGDGADGADLQLPRLSYHSADAGRTGAESAAAKLLDDDPSADTVPRLFFDHRSFRLCDRRIVETRFWRLDAGGLALGVVLGGCAGYRHHD